MRKFSILLAASVLLCASCGEKDGNAPQRFSAYALSNTTTKGAFAISRASAIEAQRASIAACEAAAGDGFPCRQVQWFSEGCGAIALGGRPTTGVTDWVEATRNGALLQVGNGVGKDAATACSEALDVCQSAGGINCAAREFACMDDGVIAPCPASTWVAKPRVAAASNFIGYAYSKLARSGAFAMSELSVSAARDSAVSECAAASDAGDCTALAAFEAECAAIAAADGVIFAAPAPNAAAACKAAEATCSNQAGTKCRGVTHACRAAEPGFCNEFE